MAVRTIEFDIPVDHGRGLRACISPETLGFFWKWDRPSENRNDPPDGLAAGAIDLFDGAQTVEHREFMGLSSCGVNSTKTAKPTVLADGGPTHAVQKCQRRWS